jgi:xanthine dehydrogenase YagR molybdenum-binding subunit
VTREITLKTGYPGAERDIVVKVHDLDAAPWGLDAKLRVVGTDVPRLDGLVKATGAARYAFDVRRPRMAYAKELRCFRAHAKVASIDVSAAEKTPGVLAVEVLKRPGDRVTFSGESVAAVCAETEDALDDALAAIAVKYDELPHAVTTADAMQDGAARVDPKSPNVFEDKPQTRGDVEKALAEPDLVVVEAEFRTQVQTHSALEPHGCVVEPNADGTFTVWASTQATQAFQGSIAGSLGTKPAQVRVIAEHVGGGFGAKFGADSWDGTTARFAKKLNRPVKQLLDRRAEHLAAGNRPDSIQRMKLAGRKDGTLVALTGEVFGTSGNGRGGGAAANSRVYKIPNLLMKQSSVSTFTGAGRAFRAPGHPPGVFALEGILDMLAHELGADPLELRMKNDPHPIRRIQWQLGADGIDWKTSRRAVAGSDPGPVKRGVGCAAGLWYQKGGGSWVVNLHVDRTGTVTVQNAVQDIGTGTRTVIAVLVAEELGIDPADVDVRIGDTSFPAGPGSGGSTTAPSIGPAAREAGLRAREGLAALVATEWKVKPEIVNFTSGGGFVENDWKPNSGPPPRQMTFRQACALLGPDGLSVSGQRRENFAGFHGETAGCQFAQVAVDVETGVVKVERVVAVHDAGRIVDTLTARSQVNGGVIQGISYALYEDRRLDKATGDMVNPTLDTYRITGMNDCPEIDVILTSLESGFNNAGMMGLGEPATVPTAAAVANAVFNATGARLTEIPMTPARVLAAIRASEQHK